LKGHLISEIRPSLSKNLTFYFILLNTCR